MFFSFSLERNDPPVFLGILLSLFLAFSSFSCSRSRELIQRKIFRFALYSEPQSLDPRKNRDIASSMAQNMLFEGLTRLLENGQIEWAQAEYVTISEDGKVYRFHLRDTYWTDSHPVTASDFEYAWKRSLSPSFASSSSFLLNPILNAPAILCGELPIEELGVRALDEKTLEVRLSNPTPYFLSLISLCAFYPIPNHIETINPQWAINPDPAHFISNGPFKLSQWQRCALFEVVKNPLYWDAEHIYLEKIQAYVIPNEATCLQMFDTHEIDYLNSYFVPLSLDYLEDLRKRDCIHITPVGATVFCSFNLAQPSLQNRKIRQALSLAIDRQSIVANISQMDEIPASRFVPPALCSNRELHLFELFNPNLAIALFKEGLAEQNLTIPQFEKDLVFSYENTEQNRRLAQTIQQYWKNLLGFQIGLSAAEDRIHLDRLERKDYCVALDYWAAHYVDPSSILNRFKFAQSKKNYPGYENSDYIAILEQVEQTSDPTIRSQLLEKAEAIIASDLPLAPLFHFNIITLQSKQFEEINVTPLCAPIFKNIRPISNKK